MDASHSLWVFFALPFGIIVLPGMDMAYVLGNALSGGLRRGLAAVAGIVAGGVCHTLLALAGVGAVLHAAPRLFISTRCPHAHFMDTAVNVGAIEKIKPAHQAVDMHRHLRRGGVIEVDQRLVVDRLGQRRKLGA